MRIILGLLISIFLALGAWALCQRAGAPESVCAVISFIVGFLGGAVIPSAMHRGL